MDVSASLQHIMYVCLSIRWHSSFLYSPCSSYFLLSQLSSLHLRVVHTAWVCKSFSILWVLLFRSSFSEISVFFLHFSFFRSPFCSSGMHCGVLLLCFSIGIASCCRLLVVLPSFVAVLLGLHFYQCIAKYAVVAFYCCYLKFLSSSFLSEIGFTWRHISFHMHCIFLPLSPLSLCPFPLDNDDDLLSVHFLLILPLLVLCCVCMSDGGPNICNFCVWYVIEFRWASIAPLFFSISNCSLLTK